MAIGAALGLGAIAVAIIGLAVAGSASGSSSSSSGDKSGGGGPTGGGGGGGGGTGAGGMDLVTCAQAFDKIPNDPKDPVSGKGLKDVVLAAIASPTLSVAQGEALASGLEKLAAAAPDPATRNAMSVAAQCVREHASEVSKGSASGPLPDAMSCDAAFGSLPPDIQKQVIAARTAGTLVAKTTADTLDAMAALATDPSMKTVLQVAAKCLRGGGGSATGDPGLFTDEAGNYSRASGLPPRSGIASNPLFQWKHVVLPGENASVITAKYFGSAGATRARVDELILNNKVSDDDAHRNLNPRSDWTSSDKGQTPGVLNWSTLIAGDRLRMPKSWNAWIDETAVTRRDVTPYPAATVA